MKLTNHAGLPGPLVAALAEHEAKYDKGSADFSITELIGPARIAVLRQRHRDEIERDAADSIWSLFGTAVHEILRRGASGNVLSEERLMMSLGGVTISGGIDFYDEATATLDDYKSCSVYAIKDGLKDEWVAQLNGYSLLLRSQGWPVKRVRIQALLKDWHAAEAKRNAEYPAACWKTIEAPLWSDEEARNYFLVRSEIHRAAKAGKLPLCTESERWAKPPMHAVMKAGRKSAVRLFTHRQDADALAISLGAGHSVVDRPGESVRCASYCDVAPWCDWWQAQVAAARQSLLETAT